MIRYLPIRGHAGYRVGDDGSVWSCWIRRSAGKRRGSYFVIGSKWRRLRASGDSSGYPVVQLKRGNYRKVHRLVLPAFMGPPKRGQIACHNDGTRNNNRLSNLRWDTHQGNTIDRKAHGTWPDNERNGRSVLSAIQCRAIRLLYGQMSAVALSECFRISPGHARKIAKGRMRKKEI